MNRRGFLGVILATGCAPAIVRVESLMKIVVPERNILLTGLYEIYKDELRVYGGGRSGGKNSLTIAQIISKTFREHQEEIIANVEANNALLRRLQK